MQPAVWKEYKMIILLLVLAYTMSESSANNDYLSDMERPNVDVVRQLEYVPRIPGEHNGNHESYNAIDVKMIKVSNRASHARIDTLHEYIREKTVGMCDFTCNRCYRCSIVFGKPGSNDNGD